MQQPVEALEQLRDKHLTWRGERLSIPAETFEIQSKMELGQAEQAGWKILDADGNYIIIGYDKGRKELFVDRTHSGQVSFSKDFAARTAAPLPLPPGLSTCEFWWTGRRWKCSPRMAGQPSRTWYFRPGVRAQSSWSRAAGVLAKL